MACCRTGGFEAGHVDKGATIGLPCGTGQRVRESHGGLYPSPRSSGVHRSDTCLQFSRRHGRQPQGPVWSKHMVQGCGSFGERRERRQVQDSADTAGDEQALPPDHHQTRRRSKVAADSST